jgi:photosystem II stability/assembly factor-like uncharacterized protein
MNIILSALLVFTQLSVERASPCAVVDVVPVTRPGSSPGLSVPAAPSPSDLNDGFTWHLQATLPNAVFIDLSFADDSVGYACAELGIVYKTTNSGTTWTRIMNLGFPYYWYGVSAVSRARAIVSGFNNTEGTGIYRWTNDGGSTWDSIVTLDTANWLSRARFADSLRGIVSAGWVGGVWRTENGGRNPSDWTYVQIDPARGWFEGNFCYRADGRAWLTGISFCSSTDNGATWSFQHSIDPTFDGGVWFSDTLHGWTGGGQISSPVTGWVHRTADGGATWTDRLIETPEPIRAVLFINETLGFAIGGNHFDGSGAIYSTTDGGDSWQQDVNTSSEMKGIDYQQVGDSIDLWCCGFNSNFTGCIYKTRISATGSGIGESRVGSRVSGSDLRPTVIRRLPSGASAFDATGRRIASPMPGLYLVRTKGQSAQGIEESRVYKVVVLK